MKDFKKIHIIILIDDQINLKDVIQFNIHSREMLSKGRTVLVHRQEWREQASFPTWETFTAFTLK